MRFPFRNDRTSPPARPLAFALIASLTVACGTGSTPGDGVDARPIGGAPVAGRPAGGTATDFVAVPEPATGETVGTDAGEGSGEDAERPAGGTDTGSVAVPEPATGEAVGIDAGEGGGADAGTDTSTETDGVDGDANVPSAPSVVTGPLGCDAPSAALQARTLELINAARAEGRDCGTAGVFAAAGALGWDSRLEAAARTHSADMAATGNFDHSGTDGSSAGDRITREGYTWGKYAENIAAGQDTLEAAVAGWFDSPGHCGNLMTSDVSDTALACVSNDDARYRRYWTQVFARPFETRRRP